MGLDSSSSLSSKAIFLTLGFLAITGFDIMALLLKAEALLLF